ncbi:acetolactate synthase large subunit [Beijerinckia indica]|uniref:Thiamine pyrophosphate protein domain protein TPP-binding n=1 Tax=Beijerinckia indica subsp. indica (strain ATCC 9039 / DSM 1715 / NCIMB 8712) TaxID=395963 RepID=B2IBA2_BEII9|nr:acetolactate synthase large subunit [Beijerinckia indica]ACB95186.1 thiamine pyrophosphate protein domain protein TPP-binding [Beijerinckia indica subsp. indica ATCC 9039]
MNGAESLLRTLVASGIEVCFANPGTSEMHFVSALDRIEGIRPVLTLFEGVATGAADGYARMAEKPAATLLHLGPGLANGLANLHNARKAQTPMVNIIGDHATTHQRFETPLTSNVAALAQPVSHWVATCRGPKTVAADAARAVQAARVAPGQIASLILPADTAWQPAERAASPLPVMGPAPVSDQAITQARDALLLGNAALLLRGTALRGRGLRAAGRIAAATGARLLCDTFTPRIERGAGRVHVERLPYRPAPTMACLQGTRTLILVGTQAPVAFFAYPDQPSALTPPDCDVLVFSHPHEDAAEGLEQLAEAIGAGDYAPISPCKPPELPIEGGLDPESVMRIIGHYLPEDAIISDESLTSGFLPYPLLDTALPHDHLHLAGGAIGDGLPVAVGAAIACPGRKVIALQADGSAMYTLQSLWTQAREQLDITTIIYANRAYKVLFEELHSVGAAKAGPHAFSLFDLHDPTLNWVKLAEGMGVEARRVEDTRNLTSALRSAITGRGPRLIEVVL